MSTKLVAPPASGSAGWVGLSEALGALVHLLPIVTSGHGEGTGGQEEPPPSQGLPSNPRPYWWGGTVEGSVHSGVRIPGPASRPSDLGRVTTWPP